MGGSQRVQHQPGKCTVTVQQQPVQPGVGGVLNLIKSVVRGVVASCQELGRAVSRLFPEKTSVIKQSRTEKSRTRGYHCYHSGWDCCGWKWRRDCGYRSPGS